MAWGRTDPEALAAREAFGKLTRDDLRPLAGLIAADPPKKKADLVPLLARVMTDASRVRELYDRLDPVSRNAVRLAATDPAGRLDREKFRAWFGEPPRFNEPRPAPEGRAYGYGRSQRPPAPLRLFFPRFDYLPTDTRDILRGFVPPPDAFAVPTLDAPPAAHTLYQHVWHDRKRDREEWEEPVRVRSTAGEPEADLRAVLRLVDAGKVPVTDRKLVPTEATRQAVAGVLAGGDFYTAADASESKYDPAADISIKGFAWPVLMQAGGLAEKSGTP